MKSKYTVVAKVHLVCTVKFDVMANSAEEAQTIVTSQSFDINDLEDWEQDIHNFRLKKVTQVIKKPQATRWSIYQLLRLPRPFKLLWGV